MPFAASTRPLALFTACLMAILASAGGSLAQPRQAVVDDWYAALAAADRDRLSALLDADAKIVLSDLGVEQSKTEFIAALDEWQQAVAGATIRHRMEGTVGDVSTVLACYAFPANAMLMRETFRLRAGLIVENVQTPVAENCDSY